LDNYKQYELRQDIAITLHGAPRGLPQQRQHIRSLLPGDAKIVFIDDDVSKISWLVPGDKAFADPKPIVLDNVHIPNLAEGLFQNMEDRGGAMWGVYPMRNRSWQKMTVSQDKYIVGAFYGLLNNTPGDDGPSQAEDFKRQLKLISRNFKTFRYNCIGIQTTYWKGDSGGIQRTDDLCHTLFRLLENEYPGLCQLTMTRKGRPNLKLMTGKTEKLPDTFYASIGGITF